MFCHDIESLSRAEADSSTQLTELFRFPVLYALEKMCSREI